MKYKVFKSSGLRVSELCLGTMTFGHERNLGSSKKECREVFDHYVEAGGNFFDTANIYGSGESEKLLGEFAAKQRNRFVIATKFGLNRNTGNPNSFGSHRKNLIQSVNSSLMKLNTDYIDLLWIHAWDNLTPIEETMRALDDLVRQGKVLYIGASNIPAWVVSSANTKANCMGWTPLTGLQLEYSLVERSIEREYFEMATAFNMLIMAWSPIAGGILTGKYLNSTPNQARYREKDFWTNRYITENNLKISKAVVRLAQKMQKSPAQIALNWIRQKNNSLVPIIGAKNIAQLRNNLVCLDFELNEEQMKILDGFNPISKGFPHDFLSCSGMVDLIHGPCAIKKAEHVESDT